MPEKKEKAGVPVLTYHGLSVAGQPGRENGRFWVTDAAFARHLEQIRQAGLTARTLAEIRQRTTAADDEASVVLTFDDGRASDYDLAFHALVDARCQAEFFLNTVSIGHAGFLTWTQVKEMQAVGMSFQSHGHEHVDHSILPVAELRRQLDVSKQEIENRTGAAVKFFAAPYGEWSRRMVDVACEVGYEAVCTTEGRLAECESRMVDRIGIDGRTSARDIEAILTKDPAFFATRAVQFRLKRVPKMVVMQLFPGVMKAWRDRHHE